MTYDYAPASMEMAPVAQPMAQPMAPIAAPAATTEGTIVPEGASKAAQPVVDSAAFILRNQK